MWGWTAFGILAGIIVLAGAAVMVWLVRSPIIK